jgi:hypothetical protein
MSESDVWLSLGAYEVRMGPDADIGAIRRIDYDILVDLITKADHVHGAF